MTPDTLAYPHAKALADAIPPELVARGLDDLCFCGVVPGAQVSLDFCGDDCSGMAWVRLDRMYPSGTSFPIQDSVRRPGPVLFAQMFEIGLVRGLPVPDNGEAPDAAAQDGVAQSQLADMRALAAVVCDYFESRDIPYLFGLYTPYGPAGGCGGGYWTVTAQVGAV